MRPNVLIYDRPASGDAFWRNITRWVPAWEHETRAMGGYWEAGDTIHGPAAVLHQLYDRWIGSLVVEMTYGLVSWRGIVWELNLIEGGTEHRRSLDPSVFRNKEKVVYRYPNKEDSEQGNLAYSMDFTGAAHVTFEDDGQDFSPYETTSGDAVYKIEVVNDDGSKSWAFLSDKISNTEIKCCEDVERTDDGFNGSNRHEYDVSAVDAGADWVKVHDPDNEVTSELAVGDTFFIKDSRGNDGEYTVSALSHSSGETQISVSEDITDGTADGDVEYWPFAPSSYKILNLERSGTRQETAWAENADSVEEFYGLEALITEGEMATWAAEALRDTHLARYGWPRSRMTGGLTLQGGEVVAEEATLEVVCRGLWHTLEAVVIESALHGSGQSVIQMVLDESDYVSADRLERSGLNCAFRCDETPLTGMEIIEKILERGDDEGSLWQGGVYEDGFVYEAQPTAVDYFLRSGRLVDRGGQRVIPALLKPGFLLRNASAPGRGAPPGAAVRDDPRVAYVEEVRFRAPDELELKFAGQKRSVEVVEQMLRRRRGERQ